MIDMEIKDLLTPEFIVFPLQVSTKEEVISSLVGRLYERGKISNYELAKKVVLDRETLMTTGIGKGVAFPHGRYPDIENVIVSIGIAPKGIDFKAVDGQPVSIFVLLLSPEKYPNKHLKILGRFSKILNIEECRQEILTAKSAEKIAEIFYKYDN